MDTILNLLAVPPWLQVTTPVPQIPVWQMTESQVPWVVALAVALIAFLLGTTMRPLLEAAGSALLRWTRSIGKSGAFRQSYLNSLVSQYRHLKMLPANILAARWEYRRAAIELEELYTPLRLDERSGDEDRAGFRSKPSGGGLRNSIESVWRRIRPPAQPSAGDIGLVIQRHPRLVIRGDPGSGKTTLLRYLALTCARSLRNAMKDGDDWRLAKRRLGWRNRPFPILVSLNLLGDVNAWLPNRRLVDEIVNTLPGDLRNRCPDGFFERQLRRGNCLVLFDGFDELGSRQARGRMARLIDDLATSYNGRGNQFVVSTRIVGYEGQLNSYGFTVRTIQELNREEVRDLVERRYRAIAVGEGFWRSEQERSDLLRLYQERADDLLMKLNRNDSLRLLTTNPLLLSLIVLVHVVKIELPEQRHILYRDCVEILTDRWQVRKHEEAGLVEAAKPDALTLDQKMLILRDIALTMQQRRQHSGSTAVIGRSEVEALVAARLPSFIAAYLPEPVDARAQECQRRAEALLDNLKEESGILVERGLDAAGEPVVGFSHLTFQEYLAADAIRERPVEFQLLVGNLFNPSWREVLLLYVNMQDADAVVAACLNDARHLELSRYLLAGRCLAENKVTVDPELRGKIVGRLLAYLSPSLPPEMQSINDFLTRIGGEKNYDWLIDSFPDYLSDPERLGVEIGPDLGTAVVAYRAIQQALVRVMQQTDDSQTRYTAGCILSGIGDPRQLDEMVKIPAGEFTMGSNRFDLEKPAHSVHVDEFSIGKYPVTNGQYLEFVKAVGHRPPPHWQGEIPPSWLMNHPVVTVSWFDARAYCDWLTETKGRIYRLPTEADWEKAARGNDGREYPWGDEPPDTRRCNYDSNVGTTTSVGSYPDGSSPYGVLDMAGNVWEWTSSKYLPYPYAAGDGREDPRGVAARTLRGGSWLYYGVGVRCANRVRNVPDYRYDHVGFRVVTQ